MRLLRTFKGFALLSVLFLGTYGFCNLMLLFHVPMFHFQLEAYVNLTHQSAVYVPSGGPVFVNPQAAPVFENPIDIVKPTKAHQPNNLLTQTVYGFLDFTTTIGNTVMVFSPQSAAPVTTSGE